MEQGSINKALNGASNEHLLASSCYVDAARKETIESRCKKEKAYSQPAVNRIGHTCPTEIGANLSQIAKVL